MRAHKALELVRRVSLTDKAPADLHESLAGKMIGCEKLLEDAVTFDFGSLFPPQEHREFGLDLLSRRMLRLPYPVVFFSCGDGEGADASSQGKRFYLAAVVNKPTDEDMELIADALRKAGMPELETQKNIAAAKSIEDGTLTVMRLVGAGDAGSLDALLPSADIKIVGHHPGNFEAVWWHIGLNTKEGSKDTESLEADACAGAGVVAGLVSMLMSKDILKVSVPAPDKLNKAREKKGKPPIRDAYEIRLKLGAGSSAATPSLGETINGRKSPRMHWRRGHYRRHHLDRERLIPIPPCLVNAADDAQDLAPSDYIFPSAVGINSKRTIH